MAALASIYLKKETLQTLLSVLDKKQQNGVELTVSINDETTKYGQNLSAYVSQSKEDREQNKSRYYVGNGKVFWTNGKIVKAEKRQQQQETENEDEMPF